MKNFDELTMHEKINLSTTEAGLTEEQIFELHIAGVDKIGLILTADADILAKITDMEQKTAKEIKETLSKKGITIDLPADAAEAGYDDEKLGKPYRTLEAIVQTEIVGYLRRYKEKTGISVINSDIEKLEMSEELRARLKDAILMNERTVYATFSARIGLMTYEVLYRKKMDVNLLIAFRKYICEVASMPNELYDELDEYSFKANFYEQIEMI